MQQLVANEVELKLTIESKDTPLLWRHPCIVTAAIGKPVRHKLITSYYDTPDLKLYKAGISLRIRRISGQWVQSIKSIEKAQAGLHQRMEWEDVIASGHPDFTKINKKPLNRIFANPKLRDAINPIFRTEILRTELQLAFDDDRLELALDIGQLVVGETKEKISEIELELKEGARGRLFELALQLQRTIPLRLKNVSKAQHGYAFYAAVPPSAVKGQLPELALRDSAEEAFVKIAWECMHHLQMNQDVVLYGDDVEGTHQMRVAVRRLRSAFTVFKKVLGEDASRELMIELNWLANALGKARDLDVFLTETLPQITSEFQNHAGLIEIHQKALIAKKEIYIELYELLNSQRYNRLMLAVAAWLENKGWRENGDSNNHLVRDIAKVTLDKRHRILQKSGKSLASMLPNDRHKARISTKKLRYASEFFASLYSSKKASPYILRLSQLQDCLGVLNDISTTERVLSQVITTKPSRILNEGLYIFLEWNAYRNRYSTALMKKSWRKFIKQEPFWH